MRRGTTIGGVGQYQGNGATRVAVDRAVHEPPCRMVWLDVIVRDGVGAFRETPRRMLTRVWVRIRRVSVTGRFTNRPYTVWWLARAFWGTSGNDADCAEA